MSKNYINSLAAFELGDSLVAISRASRGLPHDSYEFTNYCKRRKLEDSSKSNFLMKTENEYFLDNLKEVLDIEMIGENSPIIDSLE